MSQTVASGAAISLSVNAVGVLPLAYQWKKDAVDIAGATNAALIISAAAESDEGSYTCTVSNEVGSDISREAVVSVT